MMIFNMPERADIIQSHYRCLVGIKNSISNIAGAVRRHAIYLTRETVFHQDIQTLPRRELKIRRAAEYF